ncbi:uncharacterized protein LOC116297923 [Actinia tenebrosa]|uniref:Uncharacterized protein LOC116297923 n=1 Tax=Actinia tenebrosa TaxID=6105 RepID=A0A6P8IA90_ACTTE|nr:uncharacterized protein LOC116297923 [Actinia tenebrosa]
MRIKKSADITPSPPPDPVQQEQGEMPASAVTSNHRKFIFGILFVGAVLTVVLVVLGYQDVNFYEYGFLKRKSTGKVDTSKVYLSGRHFVGPDYTFKKFKADAHFEDINNIAVFTSDKLEVQTSCAFQYFLKIEDLADLHNEYDLFYQPVIRSTALSALKGRAALISIEYYLRQRARVEQQLFQALKDRLNGVCCRENCESTNSCKPGCKPRSSCLREDKGLFVEVDMFQLHAVLIPNDVKSRYLSQVIENAKPGKRKLCSTRKGLGLLSIVRKETEKMIQQIKNEAQVISQNASAQAELSKTRARSQALVKVEKARNSGLGIIHNRLNITIEQHKASFNYLRALRDHKSVALNVNYDTLMARD